jgi:hypothetical protein
VRTSDAEVPNTVDDRPKNFPTEAEIGDFLKAAGKKDAIVFAIMRCCCWRFDTASA